MGRIHMNFKKKLLLLATSALAMLTLSACSKNSSSTDGKVATNITKKTTVVFWHSMTGASEKCMKQYAAEFEKNILTYILNWKTKVIMQISSLRLMQLCNHLRICQLLLRLTQVGCMMLLN